MSSSAVTTAVFAEEAIGVHTGARVTAARRGQSGYQVGFTTRGGDEKQLPAEHLLVGRRPPAGH